MEFLTEYILSIGNSYWGLFVASFLAATILPFSSEIFLGYMLTQDANLTVTLFSATSGNVLGSVVNYGIGMGGSRFVFHKFLRMPDQKIKAAKDRFRRYGTISLLFAWVPVIGDPLTVAAGVLKIKLRIFLVLVGTGKFLRYVFIAWAVLSV